MTEDRSSAVLTGMLLVAATACAVAFVVAFARDASNGWLGLTLAGAFGALGLALGVWSHRLVPHDDVTHDRPRYGPATDADAVEATETIQAQSSPVMGRRLLTGLLATAGGVLAVSLLAPLSSLGPSPISTVGTSWRRDRALVDADGRRIRADDLERGEVLTVFPAGVAQRADEQVILMALPIDELTTPAEWSPDGLTAFSKVCTHAGCPVGLYQQEAQRLICPCHQATFDVLDGCRPVFGPAPVPLPQLPLRIDAEGYLVADGTMTGQVGPRGWWSGGDAA